MALTDVLRIANFTFEGVEVVPDIDIGPLGHLTAKKGVPGWHDRNRDNRWNLRGGLLKHDEM
jgi:hypothetical protein